MGRFLMAFGDTVRSLSDPEEIEGEACALLCEALSADRVVFLEITEAETRTSVSRDAHRNNSKSAVGKYVLSDFTWAHEIWSQARCILIEDTQRCDVVPEHARAALAAIPVIGALAVPVFKGSTLVGALCAHVGSPRAWSNEEACLLDRAAVILWATLLQARTAQALQAKSIELSISRRNFGYWSVTSHLLNTTPDNCSARPFMTGCNSSLLPASSHWTPR